MTGYCLLYELFYEYLVKKVHEAKQSLSPRVYRTSHLSQQRALGPQVTGKCQRSKVKGQRSNVIGDNAIDYKVITALYPSKFRAGMMCLSY